MSRRKLPIAVAHAINTEDKQLLSILGRKGGEVTGKRRSEDAIWREILQERMTAAIAADLEAMKVAERDQELMLLGLDHHLAGAYPEHANDSDYELIPYAA